MHITEIEHEAYVTLIPEGDLDAHSSIGMDESIRRLLDAGRVKFHIDCSKIAYISSAGLGVFISFMEELRSRGGEFVFSDMDENIYRVFELLGLHLIARIVPTADEAGRLLTQ